MLITLPLYVLRELGKALGLALLVFSFIMLAVFAGQVVREGTSLWTLLCVLPKLFPLVSPMVLPLTIMTGTLLCYGRLSSGNEFVAAQASGIHPAWLAAPAMGVATLAATITVFLNSSVLGVAIHGIEKTLIDDRTDILRRRLSKAGNFTLQSAVFCRLKPEGGRTGIEVTVFGAAEDKEKPGGKRRWDPEYPHAMVRLIGRNHTIGLDPTGQYMQAEFEDFQQYDLDARDLQPMNAGRHVRQWPTLSDDSTLSISSDRLTYWDIGRLLAERRKGRERLAEAEADYAKAPPAERENDERALRNLRKSVWKQTAELNVKLALSFACLGFAAIGVPLGLLVRRNNVAFGFVVGTLVSLLYFLMVKFLVMPVREGWLGWWVLWLPNVALLVVGAGLWIRSQRLD